MKKHLFCLFALSLLTALTGCVKVKQTTTLKPDGSGKMALRIAINEQMLAMGGNSTFFEHFSPQALAQQEAAGWVAFTQPTTHIEGNFKIVEFVGYFRDINTVRFGDSFGNPNLPVPSEESKATTYALNPGQLQVTRSLATQVIHDLKEDGETFNDPATRAMMAPMMEGFEITEQYVMPGTITNAPGYETHDTTANLTITADNLLADEPFTIAALEDNVAEITFTPNNWTNNDQAAWQTELAAAETAWAKIKTQETESPPTDLE
ncbi:MAG: hypothetical protein V3V20_11075 [Algisphaera sp.]